MVEGLTGRAVLQAIRTLFDSTEVCAFVPCHIKYLEHLKFNDESDIYYKGLLGSRSRTPGDFWNELSAAMQVSLYSPLEWSIFTESMPEHLIRMANTDTCLVAFLHAEEFFGGDLECLACLKCGLEGLAGKVASTTKLRALFQYEPESDISSLRRVFPRAPTLHLESAKLEEADDHDG